jgi:hypothetical protein
MNHGMNVLQTQTLNQITTTVPAFATVEWVDGSGKVALSFEAIAKKMSSDPQMYG